MPSDRHDQAPFLCCDEDMEYVRRIGNALSGQITIRFDMQTGNPLIDSGDTIVSIDDLKRVAEIALQFYYDATDHYLECVAMKCSLRNEA